MMRIQLNQGSRIIFTGIYPYRQVYPVISHRDRLYLHQKTVTYGLEQVDKQTGQPVWVAHYEAIAVFPID